MEDLFDRFQAITGISKYSNSEVIPPQNIVKDMVDLLPAKGPQSLMRAARPQSPAVRGFSEKRQPPSVWRFYRTIAVGHSAKSRVCRALRRF